MLEANVKLLEEMKGFVHYVGGNPELLRLFTHSDKDFTRQRKPGFGEVVLLIARLCKKTLSVELESFFEQMGSTLSCTVSAFVQQRLKLCASFFYCWNLVLWLNFYRLYGERVRRWRGYRVVALDGSSVHLVNTGGLRAYFGGQSNQHSFFACAGAFYCYDVLNEMVLYADLVPYRYGELNLAYGMIPRLDGDMLAVYDRNFGNYKVMALHRWQETETRFVIRAKGNLKVVQRFLKSGQTSSVEELLPSDDAIRGLRKSGYIITPDTALRVRLVRVELESSVEVLFTNLWEEEGYESSLFQELYALRWGVETAIGVQKNILQLESFSGLTVEAVLQDFYATVLMANLHSVLIKEAQQILSEKLQHRKYPMKVNKNKSFAKLKSHLVTLFVHHSPVVILQLLQEHFIRDPLPVRKGRRFERRRKNPQTKSKHKTFTNFKPSY